MTLGDLRRGFYLWPQVKVGRLGLALPLLVLAGCKAHLSFLDPQGPIAAVQAWHFYWVLGIMAVLVAGPIFLVLPFFAWRYRYGARTPRFLPKPPYTPKWDNFAPLAIACWAGPILIVAVLAFFVWRDAHRLDPYKPLASSERPLRVEVVGYDWKWLFIYPEERIASVGEMAMPAGRPVALEVTSATVMQSFFVPALGSQIYAMGGMVTRLNLEAKAPGTFLGENTMYNGEGFHAEKFDAVAMTPASFSAWVQKAQASGTPLNAAAYRTLSARGSRQALLAALSAPKSADGAVFFRDVPANLLAVVVAATTEGAGVSLGGPAPMLAGPPAGTPAKLSRESNAPPARGTAP
ncbi:MAG: ubiquinol oxidase subunit II [Caulobacteraceae bacterium]